MGCCVEPRDCSNADKAEYLFGNTGVLSGLSTAFQYNDHCHVSLCGRRYHTEYGMAGLWKARFTSVPLVLTSLASSAFLILIFMVD